MSMARDEPVATRALTTPQTTAGHIHIQWTHLDGRRVRLWSWQPRSATRENVAGCPLLLLHGLGCAVEFWLPTLRHLARRGFDRPVYAVDLPGSGRSEGPRQILSIPELAEWTVRLMGLLDIPSAHLIGNSLGCQVALAIARQHPERATSLVLGGVTPGGDLIPLWRMGLGLMLDGVMEPGVYDGSIPRMYFQTGPRRYFATAFKIRNDHPVRDAAQVVAPCLVVRGNRDTVVPDWAARTVADALPRGTYQVMEGSPHAVQYAVPESYTQLLTSFCQQTEPADVVTANTAPVASETNWMTVGVEADPVPGLLRMGNTSAYYEVATPGSVCGTQTGAATTEPLPVLLLHGLAGSGKVWSRFFHLLNKNQAKGVPPRTVYVPDLPGFGQSPAGTGLLGIDGLSDWCVQFLNTVSVERVDIAAHSMGCQVALALAERYPNRVGRLVLVGPTTGNLSVPLWRYFLGSLAGGAREPLYYRLLALRMFWRMGIRRYVEALRYMMKDDVIRRAQNVQAPCLVVRGERDTIIPETAMGALVAALPEGSYQRVVKAAHMVPFTAPEELAHLAQAFWNQSLSPATDLTLTTDTRVPIARNWGKALATGTE